MKKILLPSVVLFIAFLVGVIVYVAQYKPVAPPSSLSINYFVSNEDPNKYCNGDDMDSEGYRKTITVEKMLTLDKINA